MKLFRGFAVASAVGAFAVAVLGSWVRINDAGLTCPDWPLCHGHLVPTLTGGVVLEWSHRLIALLEAFAVVGTIVTGLRVRTRVAGITWAFVVLGVIFVAQILLGGATVLLANSPLSVMLHWAMGMALVATLTSLAVCSIVVPSPTPSVPSRRAHAAAACLGIAAAFAFLTMCAGAYVSSSYAGLACASLPGCSATVFGSTAAQAAQMVHRLFAALFAIAALVSVIVAVNTSSARVRVVATGAFGFVILQIFLGLANVALRLPTGLREAHAANAVLTFLAFVVAGVLAKLEPNIVPQRSSVPVLGGRIASNA